jgi:uncharacterized protein (TIGR02217 family)
MSEFLEEQLPVGVRLGASFADDYQVEIVRTAGGQEYRRLVHPFPQRRFRVHYTRETVDLWDEIIALYHRAYGRFAGFRVQAIDDYSTNGHTGTPTATDQDLALVSAGVYQLQKAYGAGGTPLGIGLPVRTIYKPVASTTLVSVGGVEIDASMITIDTTAGTVTFDANKTANITGITQAASAVVTVGAHSFAVDESVHFSSVAGMTQINGLRGTITAIGGTTITVDINSSAFTAYSSGGSVNTRPQSGEDVMGGCQFDIPCRFDTALEVIVNYPNVRETDVIELVELINL